MKRFIHTASTMFFVLSILFVNPVIVSADEAKGGHGLELEVNGYHVTLASENEWLKGENAVVVTLTDSMGMPVSDADVKILITPKVEEHIEENSHGGKQSHNSMPGMDMGEPEPGTSGASTYEDEAAIPLAMIESPEHGEYMVKTHLEASGEYDIQVFFHVNGEMMQADFLVEIAAMASKTIVLWSFAVINVGLIVSAGILKKQSVPVKVK